MIPDNEEYLSNVQAQHAALHMEQEIALADGEWLCTNLHQVSLALQNGGAIVRRAHGHHILSFDHPRNEAQYEAALLRASARAGRVG